jgi:phosphate starvation-inducible PhoH-like protein
MSKTKDKKEFNIPQLKQNITVNCKRLDDKQLGFLAKSLSDRLNIMFISGPAGTSKTYMSVYSALRILSDDDTKDLLYVRTVIESADKGLGALPGDLDEKFNPYMAPLLDKLSEMLPDNSTLQSDLLDKGRIKAMPINFIRGANWEDKVVVADEAQNFTFKELTTLITRLGKGSKLFICGDPMQSDISRSGFVDMCKVFNDSESRKKGIDFFEFDESDVKRRPLIKFIITKLNSYNEDVRN